MKRLVDYFTPHVDEGICMAFPAAWTAVFCLLLLVRP